MSKILKEGKSYTFSDYFDFNYPIDEILSEFGYHFVLEALELPQSQGDFSALSNLRESYTKKLPFISLNSEAAKREFYIAPFLLGILDYCSMEIKVEYPLDGGENLSGYVDYLLQLRHENMTHFSNLIIIEAKKGDLEKGFTQLAIELIALDKILEPSHSLLYGAITLGDIWRFGILERDRHLIKKDLNAYPLLANLETLCSILIGILDPSTIRRLG
ncbi:MAG: hypothetical protein ACOYME_04395 [Prochlorotrichaceae cyanobacterium]|jgi:hypothetical protein